MKATHRRWLGCLLSITLTYAFFRPVPTDADSRTVQVTAYCLPGRTASGAPVGWGGAAAEPRPSFAAVLGAVQLAGPRLAPEPIAYPFGWSAKVRRARPLAVILHLGWPVGRAVHLPAFALLGVQALLDKGLDVWPVV